MKFIFVSLLLTISLWADAHIFVYHRFGDTRYPTTNTTIEELRKEFEYFKNNNYKVIPLEKLVNAIKSKKNIPDNWVVLTIDDNFKSFYDNGFKIFKEYNYPFSLFVYVEATQKRFHDYLTWKQLKEISKFGSLEFHTYGHLHMTNTSDALLKADFEKGLKLFQSKLGTKPKFFTYPYGEYSKRVQTISKLYGFEAIINQNMGAVSKFSDMLDLDRTALVGKSNLKLYLKNKALKADWIEPNIYPKNAILSHLHVKTNEKSKHGKIYLSGYGWNKVEVNDGDFNVVLHKKILKKRSRIIVSINDKISTKLLIKDNYGTK